ncbi:MAG: helix-turn-helix transcriptional regulator [Oscillospiraceae bacterium]|nr:helix-turn-helix transcriptional regulator [Oscillospiraceae bacterium]
MFRYKVDIISRLKEAGYSTYRLQKEKLLATTTLVKLRNGNTTITLESLNAICDMLECQPGELIEWYRDEFSE